MSELQQVETAQNSNPFVFIDEAGSNAEFFDYYEIFFIHRLSQSVRSNSIIAKTLVHIYEPFIKDKVKFSDGSPNKKNNNIRYGETPSQIKNLSDSDWKLFQEYYKNLFENYSAPPQSIYFENLSLFQHVFGFEDHMKWPFIFLETLRQSTNFRDFTDAVLIDNQNNLGRFFAAIIPNLTAQQRKDITHSLDINSELVTKGLVIPSLKSFDEDTSAEQSEVIDDILELLYNPDLTQEKIIEEILGEPKMDSELAIENFPHLEKEIQNILNIIKGAIETGEKGINILLYGPPGSGKTVLAAAIAKALGKDMFTIGERNPDDGEKEHKNGSGTSKYRIAKLQQAYELLKGSDNSILLFDEIEDMLNKGTDSSTKPDVFSKVLFNRLLENNPIVTIWAGNDLEKFHESVLQRFTYSLPVTYPPTLMREKMWRMQAQKNNVILHDSDILQLARDFIAPPRIIASSLRSARLSGKINLENIVHFIEQASLITYGSEDELKQNSGLSKFFDPKLLPEELSQKIEAYLSEGAARIPASVYIEATAGAGIGALGEYMAERWVMHPAPIDVEMLSKDEMTISAKDKIKAVFKAAARGNKLLVFKNIEAFNANPEKPDEKSWDMSLVHEFVKAASKHELPFIVSSFKEGLILPKPLQQIFSMQSKMGALDEARLNLACKTYLGFEWLNNGAEHSIVAADFSFVEKIQRRMAERPSQPALVDMVIEQSKARSDMFSKARRVDFG